MTLKQWSAVAVAAVLAGCGPDSAASLSEFDDDGDGIELSVAELNVDAVLAFLNGPEASIEVLDVDVGLTTRAATNIVTRTWGMDLRHGTADDRPLRSVADLKTVGYVGDASVAAIDRFVTLRGGSGSPAVTVKSVGFTAAEATLVVAIANDARLAQVGLSATQQASVIAARPLANLQALANVYGIGTVALQKFKALAASQPAPQPTPVTPASCTETAGNRDGVYFTAEEACRAVEFLNKARTSEMQFGKAIFDLAWHLGPSKPHGLNGRSVWARLNEFTDTSGIGTTTVQQLRHSIQGWQANGLTYDTVANVWANRSALKDKPVRFEKVFVKRVLPMEVDPQRPWMANVCAELRDTPTASNFLMACQTISGADSARGCSYQDCITHLAGQYVHLRGELNLTSMPGTGGFRVNFGTAPSAPSPVVP